MSKCLAIPHAGLPVVCLSSGEETLEPEFSCLRNVEYFEGAQEPFKHVLKTSWQPNLFQDPCHTSEKVVPLMSSGWPSSYRLVMTVWSAVWKVI